MAYHQLQPATVDAGAGPGHMPGTSRNPEGAGQSHVLYADPDDRYYVADRGRAKPLREEDVSPTLQEPPLWKRILKRMVGRLD